VNASRRGDSRVHRPVGARGQDAVGALRRTAAQSGHCPRHGRQAAVLLYDEPTTGLDPITATTVDEEIVKLRDLEGVSSIVVTHQLRDAFYIAGHTATRNGEPQDPGGRRREVGGGRVHHAARRRDCVRRAGRRAEAVDGPVPAALSVVTRNPYASHPLTRVGRTSNRTPGALSHHRHGHRGVPAERRGRVLLAALRAQGAVPERRGPQDRRARARGRRGSGLGEDHRLRRRAGRGPLRALQGHAGRA
jgi:hypothetical protein